MTEINRTSKIPLYHQLYEILRREIRNGKWKPGDRLPPESELVDQYQISRTTVRQVLDLLVNEGLIYRQRGRGTFVAHPTLEQGLVHIISFTADMRRRGFEPGTEILAAETVPAPADIAHALDVAPGEELARLERLRLADDEPMSVEDSYLVHRYCRGVLRGDYASNPLSEALERDFDIRLVRARQVIRAIQAPGRLARLLSIPPGSPLLYIERVSFSQHNVPVEFLRIYYRADRYSLYNELQG